MRDLPSATGRGNRRTGRYFSLVPLVFAAALFAMGMWALVHSWNAVSGAVRTAGTVIGFRPGPRGTVSAVIRYKVDGKGYEITSEVSRRPRGYARGDPVEVLYHRERPGEGRLDALDELWIFPTVFLVFASFFATLGVLVWKSGGGPPGVDDASRADRRVDP